MMIFHNIIEDDRLYQVSKVEYTQQKILEMLVSGNHARKILKVSSKFL